MTPSYHPSGSPEAQPSMRPSFWPSVWPTRGVKNPSNDYPRATLKSASLIDQEKEALRSERTVSEQSTVLRKDERSEAPVAKNISLVSNSELYREEDWYTLSVDPIKLVLAPQDDILSLDTIRIINNITDAIVIETFLSSLHFPEDVIKFSTDLLSQQIIVLPDGRTGVVIELQKTVIISKMMEETRTSALSSTFFQTTFLMIYESVKAQERLVSALLDYSIDIFYQLESIKVVSEPLQVEQVNHDNSNRSFTVSDSIGIGSAVVFTVFFISYLAFAGFKNERNMRERAMVQYSSDDAEPVIYMTYENPLKSSRREVSSFR
eukprot:CAMPEP_0113310460 /NCGR_PEP_ID=MMETSP0010_2-20120614/8096_1 /TAXON_ID=216773 ORGANISM="Corethron hystrix, Strain 308" /NCGR_SAMPLE_ID=MMETSP0010_2 /ASSEMBLY_ACC=CAM_ASM_000155 /LENGTH=320 /DNA_ID=CAMNT_0000165919 /DNA_START=665 /DNA_END=1627 /DNA_ORIENTATION=- /assembly_acc=CAM_ASM_000155